MAANINKNLLHFRQNTKVQKFVIILFGHSIIPIISKPTKVTKKTVTAIDHVFITSATTTKFKTGIVSVKQLSFRSCMS